MNRDDIIRMAREAGFKVGTNISGVVLVGSPLETGLAHLDIEELERFATLVAAAEREECAKIAEPEGPRPCDCTDCYCGNFGDAEKVAQWDADMWTANAIRARGKK